MRFDVEVLTKGNVTLALSTPGRVIAYAGNKQIKVADGNITAALPQGMQQFSLIIDRDVVKGNGLKVELKDAPGGAQTRLRMGK